MNIRYLREGTLFIGLILYYNESNQGGFLMSRKSLNILQKLFAILLAVMMLTSIAGYRVTAEENDDSGNDIEQNDKIPVEEESFVIEIDIGIDGDPIESLFDPIDVPENDELVEQYIEHVFGISGDEPDQNVIASKLEGVNKTIYEWLVSETYKTASGQNTSSKYDTTFDDLPLEKRTWTKEDLGFETLVEGNGLAPGVQEAFMAAVDFRPSLIYATLMFERPYELYWHDKSQSYSSSTSYKASVNFNYSTMEYDSITITGPLFFYFPVAQAYQGSDEYTINPSTGTTVSNAVTNAQNIVTAYQSLDDRSKLIAYKDKICELTDYNYEAADNSTMPYGDPWQLVYVFDGDPNTKVVCEGYSKAFQYLCDSSTFQSNQTVSYIITGTLYFNGGEGGGHMWNIVHLNGKNYLADTTNCDSEAVGYPDLLFLRALEDGDSGNPSSGYTFKNVVYGYTYTSRYVYFDIMHTLYTDEELTISENDGYAYAIVSNDNLIFFRSKTSYTSGQQYTVNINNRSYTGTVYGGIESLAADNYEEIPWYEDARYITSVWVADGCTISPESMAYWFCDCSHMESFNASGFDTSNVTDMCSMFEGCASLEQLNLSSFNTSKVTDMSFMFYWCSGLETVNLSNWDTSKVQTMEGMFGNCMYLQSLDIRHFDTSKVTNMCVMFFNDNYLETIDLGNFDTSSVTTMSGMFLRCSGLEELDLSSFNTANVVDMNSMFARCTALSVLDLSSFNTSNVTDMGYMFSESDNLSSVRLGAGFSKWDSNARLPGGRWVNKNKSLIKTETELQQQYPTNASQWAGTWRKETSYSFTGFTWTQSGNGYTAKANYNGSPSGLVHSIDASVSSTSASATCTSPATTTYTASVSSSVSLDGQSHTDTKTVQSGTALGHDYRFSYVWAGNNSSVTATATCTRDASHTVTETAQTSYSVVTQPTCEGTGTGRYTATFTNSLFTKQTKDVTIPATGHSWSSNPTWIWASDYSSAKAKFVCANNSSHVREVNATINEEIEGDFIIYTATVTFNGTTYTDEQIVEKPSFTIEGPDTVVAGNTQQYEVSDPSMSSDIVWSVSDTSIATISSNGLLKGVKAGKVTITAELIRSSVDAKEIRILFTDVADSGKYFYEPVYWAFDNGITTGTSGTKFSPNDNCTRGQVVTFLWRAVGCPEPEGDNPFSDVTEDKFFYKAVLWAYENGITTGTSSNTFSPNAKCKREQIVTFLYRTAVYANSGNAPEYTPRDMNFPDVKETNYFYDAVLWAYSTGITTGVNNNTQFGVGQNCVRGMVVTFLKRYKDAY